MANTVNLYFDVNRQSIVRTDNEKVASGAVNTIVANFNFCETWNNLYRYCRFEGAGGVKDVRILNNQCIIPWEVIEAPWFKMACYGTRSSDLMITTEKISVKVYQSINFVVDDALPQDQTPNLLMQFENIIERAAADQAANNAAQDANNARTDEMVTEVREIVEGNLQQLVTDATNATATANAAAQRANDAVVTLEAGSIPIITTAQIDSAFN